MWLLYKLNQEWKEFKAWAFKSWTIVFNVMVGLFAIFTETYAALANVVPKRFYAALVIGVPMINFFLRMRTQKKHEHIAAALKADEHVTKAESKAIG